MDEEKRKKIRKLFDSTFKTMVENNHDLLVIFLNEMFHTNYEGDETVILLSNEHIISDIARSLDDNPAFKNLSKSSILLTDSYIEVIDKNDDKKRYHIECQSNPDSSMTVRMFQYSSLIASENSMIKDGIRHFYFSNSGVLYLRDGASNQEITSFAIHNSEGEVLYQKIHNIHVKNYSREDIKKKSLFFIAPYYLMRYENDIKNAPSSNYANDNYIDELCNLCYDISEEVDSKRISDQTKFDLYHYISDVAQYIVRDNDIVTERVENIMNNIIFESPSKRFIREHQEEWKAEGRAEGRAEGIAEGRAEVQHELEEKNKIIEKLEAELKKLKKIIVLCAVR